MHWPPHPGDVSTARHGGHVGHDASTFSKRRRNLALMTLCLAMTLSGLDMTTINVALPSIAADLGASTAGLQWVVDAYTIVLAGMLLLGNGLADRFGRRRAFVVGMGLFAVATLVAAYSSSTIELIAARSLMGVGAALVLGPALSLLAVIFPPEERATALGIWTLFGALGIGFGPVIAGLLLTNFWWGSVFLVTVPVCLLGVLGGLLFLPESKRPDDQHLDGVGALLSVLGLGLFLYGVIQGPYLGWGSPVIVAALVGGAAIVVGFVVWELRSRHPMFDPRIFRVGAVVGGTLSIFMIYISFIGMLFIVPQWLQYADGRDPLEVGLMTMPIAMALGLIGPFGPTVAKHLGTRLTLTLSAMLQLVGLVVMSFVGRFDSYSTLVVGGIIAGFGLGIGIAPGTATVMNALPKAKAGDGSDANQLARQVGAAVSVAMLGCILASRYRAGIEPAVASLTGSQATEALSGISGAFSVAGQLSAGAGAALEDAARQAFASGARAAFLAAAALAAITLVVVRITVTAAADHPVDEDAPVDETAQEANPA